MVPRALLPAFVAIEQSVDAIERRSQLKRRDLNDPELLVQIGTQAIALLPQTTKQEQHWANRAVWTALGRMIPLH